MIKNKYSFIDRLVIRTPLKPFKSSFDKEEIISLMQHKQILEALYLASPSLYHTLKRWQQGEEIKNEKGLFISLNKYLLRMHNRATPFGLFAGCTEGFWGNDTAVKLKDLSEIKRHTRLDMNFICALAQTLEKVPQIKNHLYFYPNSSLAKLAGQYRYIEYRYTDDQKTHRLSAVDANPYLEMILLCAKEGASIEQLTERLVKESIDREQAREFVEQIIDEQILVSELEPAITGEDLMVQIKTVLEKRAGQQQEARQWIAHLDFLSAKLKAMDEQLVNPVEAYQELAEYLKSFGNHFDLKHLFQVDISKPAEGKAQLDLSYQNELIECLDFLDQFYPASPKETMREFTQAFYARYQDQEVPVLEALDSETGLGYPLGLHLDDNPLINDIPFPERGNRLPDKVEWPAHIDALHELISGPNAGVEQIDLSEHKLPLLKDKKGLPDTMYCFFNVLDKERLYLHAASGGSALNIVSRFAHMNSGIQELCDQLNSHEEDLNNEAIIAEIIHLPEDRMGNVLIHPEIRNYQIPYLANASVPAEYQVKLEDLMLSVSPWGDVYLRSRKHNKRVLPKLTSAYNYSLSTLPIYRFLCELQAYQLKGSIQFSWGVLSQKLKYLPRVRWKNIVLAPAQWRLRKHDIEQLANLFAQRDMQQIQTWRKALGLPKLFVLAEGDNELLVDTTNRLSLSSFLQIVKNRPMGCLLKESLVDIKQAVVTDKHEQGYTNEVIAFLTKNQKDERNNHALPQKTTADLTDSKLERSFQTGSEWLYFKVYCGSQTCDLILSDYVLPFAESLKEQNLIHKWFFIRYNDPGAHIRFRLHLKDQNALSHVLQQSNVLFTELTKNGLVHKVQTDTYEREIERYGLHTMEISEEWFYYDSKTTAKMLSILQEAGAEEMRWLYSLRAIDELLELMGYSLTEKKSLLESLKDSFSREFNMEVTHKRHLDKKFRSYRGLIEAVLDPRKSRELSMAPFFELLDEQRSTANGCMNALGRQLTNDQNSVSRNSLAASYIHMLMNRLFKSDHRAHEMVVYDFLFRCYKSALAKAAKKKAVAIS